MVTKILIVGYYGLNNIGDEAILRGIVSGLRNYIDDAKFYVFTNNGKITQSQHCVSPIEFPFADSVLKMSVNNLVHNRLSNLIKYINDCDIFILGGGALLQDLKIYYLPFWLSMLYYAQFRNKKTVVYGVGAGPIDTKIGKNVCKYVLNKADVVSVRDPISKHVLEACGVNEVIQTADPAFSIDISKNENIDYGGHEEKANFMISTLYNWLHDSDKYHNLKQATEDLNIRRKLIAGIFSEICDIYKKNILFVPTVKIDQEGYYEIKKIIKNNNYIDVTHYRNDIDYYLDLFRKPHLVIGSRLHSLIFSTMVGTPIVPISYCMKTKSYLELLRLKDFYLDIENLEQGEFKDALIKNINVVIKNRNYYRNILLNRARELKMLSLTTAKIVSEL